MLVVIPRMLSKAMGVERGAHKDVEKGGGVDLPPSFHPTSASPHRPTPMLQSTQHHSKARMTMRPVLRHRGHWGTEVGWGGEAEVGGRGGGVLMPMRAHCNQAAALYRLSGSTQAGSIQMTNSVCSRKLERH